MKKHFFLLFIGLLSLLPAKACDVCGCGAGSYYFGVMPQFHRSFMGLRYRQSGFFSHRLGDGSYETQENFHTAELWGRFYPSPKIQVLAFLPYSRHSQRQAENMRQLSGPGDMSLLANYNLLNTTTDTADRLFRHNLLLGGGIKLPTGKFRYVETGEGVANPNFQLGTGSLDYLINSVYTLRRGKWGLNADATWRITTENPEGYRFGQRYSGNLLLFRVQRAGMVALMPMAGMYAEYSKGDHRLRQYVFSTGGHWMAAVAGMELYAGRLAAGINLQLPLAQDLGDGMIHGRARVMTHLSFLL